MTAETPIDEAHANMTAAPEDEHKRLRFFDRIAQSEVYILLTAEPDSEDTIDPELFEVGEAQYLLAFDRLDRLAQFVGAEAPYAAVSGRVVALMLAGQNIGVALNLEVAPSSILLPPDAMAWLNETLDQAPDELEARPTELRRPTGLPEQMISILDTRLASAMGLARCAYLVAVRYDSGATGHMLAFVSAIPQAQGALTQLASDALTFSGVEAGSMDVAFFRGDDPLVARMDRVGLRFDLPQPEDAGTATGAPGRDPEKPPILR